MPKGKGIKTVTFTRMCRMIADFLKEEEILVIDDRKKRKAKLDPAHNIAVTHIVERYCSIKGYHGVTDQAYWGRWKKDATRLLTELAWREDLALEALDEIPKEWIGIDWGLGGVANRATEWRAQKIKEGG